ncbi:hypothetical protein HanHA300_Chr00c0136g0717101 [Helianthus annuus]|nr:hypothetical protein HanHA300_Chr00c0136g0717101 [Helianthus annuus]KAJ0776130.1 hypothetical protein HanLR1_Chr02g0042091 [Helianthus annuus]
MLLQSFSPGYFFQTLTLTLFTNYTPNRVISHVLCPNYDQVAVEEVVNKVLSEPIRPHFAIASIGPSFDLQEAHQLITTKLGSQVPVITNDPSGIIGRDAISDEFKEIQWEITEEDEDTDVPPILPESANRAIMLIVGFLPGLKVTTIPLLKQVEVISYKSHLSYNVIMVVKIPASLRFITNQWFTN